MNFPADLKYTRNDEWVRVEGNTATAGITDFAQEQLSDIVYVELPAVGDTFQKGESYGSVESVKAASDVYLPLGGAITAINDVLSATPEVVNSSPYDQGWMVKFTIANLADLEGLMDVTAYQKFCEERKS